MSHPRIIQAIAIMAVLLLVVAIILCWRRLPITRLWSSLLIVQGIVLMSTPVYFKGYSSFIAPALLLVVGSAVGLTWGWLAARGPLARGVGVAALVVILAVTALVSVDRDVSGQRLDDAGIAAAAPFVAGARCVGSDTAGVLILSNVLTRNLENGCPAIFDFDGIIYSVDGGRNPKDLSSTKRRRSSAAYQAILQDYLAANDVVMMHRQLVDGLSATTRALLHARPLLAHVPGLRVYGATG